MILDKPLGQEGIQRGMSMHIEEFVDKLGKATTGGKVRFLSAGRITTSELLVRAP